MDKHGENVYQLLITICPEMLKPFAEAMLPTAIEQMEEEKKLELEVKLEEMKDKPEEHQAEMLIEFAKTMGADPSMFAEAMPPELASYF